MYLSVPLFFLPFFSLSPLFFFNCSIMFPFLLFPRFFFVGCLSVFVLVWLRFVFPSVFFFIHTCLSDYRSLHSSTHIYAYTYAYVLSVYSVGSIFPSFSFLHKFYCTNVQPKVNPCLWHQCDNTRFCSSLHKLLSPRLNTYVGRIKARSRFTEKRTKTQQQLVVKTSREDGERTTLCG